MNGKKTIKVLVQILNCMIALDEKLSIYEDNRMNSSSGLFILGEAGDLSGFVQRKEPQRQLFLNAFSNVLIQPRFPLIE